MQKSGEGPEGAWVGGGVGGASQGHLTGDQENNTGQSSVGSRALVLDQGTYLPPCRGTCTCLRL